MRFSTALLTTLCPRSKINSRTVSIHERRIWSSMRALLSRTHRSILLPSFWIQYFVIRQRGQGHRPRNLMHASRILTKIVSNIMYTTRTLTFQDSRQRMSKAAGILGVTCHRKAWWPIHSRMHQGSQHPVRTSKSLASTPACSVSTLLRLHLSWISSCKSPVLCPIASEILAIACVNNVNEYDIPLVCRRDDERQTRLA